MAMATIDLTDTVQASLKGGPEAVLSIWDDEKEISVRIPWGRSKVKCGGKTNTVCPGFVPGNIPYRSDRV